MMSQPTFRPGCLEDLDRLTANNIAMAKVWSVMLVLFACHLGRRASIAIHRHMQMPPACPPPPHFPCHQETEDLNLPPETIRTGVEVVLKGSAGAKYFVLESPEDGQVCAR